MTEQHSQTCRFCQRNVKLAYYCEECGANCCSDCLHEERIDSYKCQDCNSKNVEFIDSGKKKICKECGSENISQKSQLLKSCPKCHSHQIINIYEKKEELEKKFMDLIKTSRAFVEPFRDLGNSLSLLRQQVNQARAPPIRCYHFPTMEADLLSLFKLFIYTKDNLLDKIKILFHQFSQNKQYFFDIYTQQNSNIRYIEGILDNLTRNYGSINEFISNNTQTIKSGIKNMRKNLRFIDKIKLYFQSYKKFLNLAEQEKPVYAIHAKLANGLNTHDKYKKNRGILFITNYDLSFVHEFGRLKKKKEIIFKAPVEDLIRMNSRGKVFKRLYIEFSYGKYEFTLSPNAISRVIDYILLARNFDEMVIYNEDAANKLFDLDIELTDITSFIEEGINSFFSLKCQYNNISINREIELSYPNRFNHHRPPQQGLFQMHPNSRDLSYNPYYSPSPYAGNQDPRYSYANQIKGSHDQMFFGNPNPQDIRNTYENNPFYAQNIFHPNRKQNYPSQTFHRTFDEKYSDFENKLMLMRKLEQMQRNNNQNPSHTEKDPFFIENFRRKFEQDISSNPSFDEYSGKHMSSMFNRADNYNETPTPSHHFMNYNEKKYKKMLDLEKEHYGLSETLKELDSKFEQGIISEIDYFRRFRNLQKEIYLNEKRMESLSKDITEGKFFRRNGLQTDKKKYYT